MFKFIIGAIFGAAAASDEHKQLEQIAFENGFAAESYTVITGDGYVSQMFRIPGTLQESARGDAEKKPAVLMMHGLECDHMIWVANDADIAPAFILAS